MFCFILQMVFLIWMLKFKCGRFFQQWRRDRGSLTYYCTGPAKHEVLSAISSNAEWIAQQILKENKSLLFTFGVKTIFSFLEL